ncbi:MAG: exodeoxyribonuclease III [Gammaproteobacteria bacterium]|nr:exodeoxyribonuclease III [Gammaproteobacteria bacterium]
MLRIATWNVNSLRVRLSHVLDWLAHAQPDILALQETKLPDEDFPTDSIHQSSYQAIYAGQKTYNGVATLSRQPGTDVITDLPGLNDPQRRLLGASYGEVMVLNVYVPNGAEVSSDKYAYKLEWLSKLHAYIEELLARKPHLIVLGDFNIAPEDRDVHDPVAWEGKVLVSEPERNQFKRLLELGLVDCFRVFEQASGHFSWWDYRAAAFRRNQGLRIDHILISSELAKRCTACYVDKRPRALDRPSDHVPVVAEFTL